MGVRIYCPCGGEKPFVAPYSIEYLYFCPRCNDLRCPQCAEYEVLVRYCPSCLFEVTPTTARHDGNRCTRTSCCQCPKCHSSCSVISKKGEEEGYILQCAYCKWTNGVVAAKPGLLTSQLGTESSGEEKRFTQLREVYHAAAVEELAGPQPLTTVSKMVKKKEQDKTSEIKTIEDNFNCQSTEPNNPIFRQLRAKYTKRCRACRHLLVKPEVSPSSVKMRAKYLAIDYVPSLSVVSTNQSPSPEGSPSGGPLNVKVMISNPMVVPLKINLATQTNEITITTPPTFSLGPAPEQWDEISLLQGVPPSLIKRQTTASKRVQMEGPPAETNWALIGMEVHSGSEIKLLVSYEFAYEDQEPTKVACWYLITSLQ
ncbi:hypothetical protein TRVA0_045S00254 [Trichomonascus vanleenenianus]|uniref:uncharacterized protein n=1 Tax=Trichomonascus vanleenenianus TaxID=2268995 RepID=UPI003EC9D51A